MDKLRKNKTLLIFLGISVLLPGIAFIGLEIGWITKPMIKNAIGMGMIGGAAVLMIAIPLVIVQKVWLWIKSKL